MASVSRRLTICFLAALAMIALLAPHLRAQAAKPAMKDVEVMALVAGNALSEDIVAEIKSHGLAFQPSEQYESLIATAGGAGLVLGAIKGAKVSPEANGELREDSIELLQHMAKAGELIRGKQYDQAAQELSAAVHNGGGAQAGFVMGEALRQKESWQQAAFVYKEVLRQAPEFSAAHTKLSFLLDRLDDPETALSEARAREGPSQSGWRVRQPP